MPKRISINQLKYDKEHIVRYSLKLHKENDKDIIEVIERFRNKQGGIKYFIRKAIEYFNFIDKLGKV